MADRWTREEQLNIAPGGTKRQEGFEKLSIEVDNLYEIGNQLDVDIKQVNTNMISRTSHMNPIVASIIFGGG